jgi:hypothetical protein
MAAAMGLFGPALIAWSSIVQLPAVGLVSTIGCAAILTLVILAAACKTAAGLRRLDLLVLLLALAMLVAWAATELYFYPAYGTDEAAFVQYSAQLVMHGRNPYATNLLPALTHFRVPIQYATYKLNGTISSNLAYPSLSVLLAIPFVLLTHGVQAIIAENVFFLAVEMVLVFLFMPRTYRSFAVVVVLGLPFLFDYTVGGDIVTMSVPFLLVLAYCWTDIGRSGRLGRGGILRAVCLGLAASVCQFAWFLAPFVLLGVWCVRSIELGRKQAFVVIARFAALAVATALVVNAPFILWSPSAWLTGVLSPLFQHAIPFGQGLIDATAFFHVGGGDLAAYTYAAAAVVLFLLVLYFQYFHWLWRATFIVPSVGFLFSTRSLSEYFIMVVAVWMVSVASPGGGLEGASELSLRLKDAPWRTKPGRYPPWIRQALLGLPVLIGLSFIVFAFGAQAPLAIRLQSVESNGQFRGIWQIHALVTNRSAEAVEPHFATDASGYMTTFWNVVSGPKKLAPGQRATYNIVAPNVGSMPGVTQPFVLQAVTASPDTISSSSLFTPESFDCDITPSYVNRILPLGTSVALNVQLRSPYGATVLKPGVRVALGQVIYAQDGLIPAEGQINSAPVGQSPVVATTNAQGVAQFHVRDASVQGGNPLYFQAYVDPSAGYPYGYSEIVSVIWRSN